MALKELIFKNSDAFFLNARNDLLFFRSSTYVNLKFGKSIATRNP